MSMVDAYQDHGMMFAQPRMSHESGSRQLNMGHKTQQASETKRRKTEHVSRAGRSPSEKVYEVPTTEQQMWNT